MKLATRVWSAGLLAAVALPANAGAQGFQLNEIGTCAIGRAQAATGAPCRDASVIYWNPAAATLLNGVSVYLGGAAVGVNGSYTQDTTGTRYNAQIPTSYVPNAFVSYRHDRWALGAGLYVPYGLTSQWGDDFPGRFVAKKARLATFYIQPNFAFEIVPGQWSIGGGPVFGHSDVELQQGVDLASQVIPATLLEAAGLPPGTTFGQLGIPSGTEFARSKLKGSATSWGFNVGVHGKVTPNVEVGARYLSKLKFNYDDASATFAQINTGLVLPTAIGPIPAGTPVDAVLASEFATGGPLVSQGVSTSISHPAQFEAGVGYRGIPLVVLSGDVSYVWWNSFNTLPVTLTGPAAPFSTVLLEQYDNSWSLKAGIEIGLPTSLKVRGGFSFTKSPAPDITVTPLLPDMNRYDFTLGLGLPIGDRYMVDGAYLRVNTRGRRGRIAERTTATNPDLTAADLNNGFYTLNANVFSLSLRANLF